MGIEPTTSSIAMEALSQPELRPREGATAAVLAAARESTTTGGRRRPGSRPVGAVGSLPPMSKLPAPAPRAPPGRRRSTPTAPKEIEPHWQTLTGEARHLRGRQRRPRPRSYVLCMCHYPSGAAHGPRPPATPSASSPATAPCRGRRCCRDAGLDFRAARPRNGDQHRRARTFATGASRCCAARSPASAASTTDAGCAATAPVHHWSWWIFHQKLFEAGLAYRKAAPVNWCPGCQTVLANEQVVDGRCRRSGGAVGWRDLEQWYLRITDYAQQLLDDLELVQWPERVVTQQRNWIGRSGGASSRWLSSTPTARRARPSVSPASGCSPPTLHNYGMTFCVLAPERPLVEVITTAERRAEVGAFVERVHQHRRDRPPLGRRRPRGRGCATGAFALRFTGTPVPILSGRLRALAPTGTGAVMAVPGEDQRDWDFATAFSIPIVGDRRTSRRLGRRGVLRAGPPRELAGRSRYRPGPGLSRGRGRGGQGRRESPGSKARHASAPSTSGSGTGW